MSEETMEWLNTMTLIGFTDKRGDAWHKQEALQGLEPNHYPGAIPLDDVYRRLFGFELLRSAVAVKVYGDIDIAEMYGWDIGQEPDTEHEGLVIPGREYYWKPTVDQIAVTTSDTHEIMGFHTDGYEIHQYKEWLAESVANILGQGLDIGSAGLLKGRKVAWVQVETPEIIETMVGFDFYSFITASTSTNGTLRTMFQANNRAVVCDNTLIGAINERSPKYSVKHSRHSQLRLNDARDALGILISAQEDFKRDVEELADISVSQQQWEDIVTRLVPVPEEEGRGKTVAEDKSATIHALYRSDSRVHPWAGSGLGVVQAFNTWNQHYRGTRGETSRQERNQFNMLNGTLAKNDELVLSTLMEVVGV